MDQQRKVVFRRGSLLNTRAALEHGEITIGFLGGSITEARVEYNWPEFVVSWFQQNYPNVRLKIENAAIGATGSDLGLFRVQRDILQRNCDLVFLEYAVNDYPMPSEFRRKAREGLVRRLLHSGTMDLVFAYAYRLEMLDEMERGEVPESIAEFEELARHYGISSVWMGLHALHEVHNGALRYDQWLPDGLHPQSHGSRIYARSVTEFLRQDLSVLPEVAVNRQLPEAIDPENWERAELLDFSQVKLKGPWKTIRSHSTPWADLMLSTSAPGATLCFTFSGRGVWLYTSFGKLSGDYRFSIDGGSAKLSGLDMQDWCGDNGWIRGRLLGYPLEPGEHTVEIEALHPLRPGRIGCQLEIVFIGILH